MKIEIEVCDRCGKRVDLSGSFMRLNKPTVVRRKRVSSDNEYDYSDALCADCTKEFEKFMKQEATQ